jgi:hypothetical protein
VIPRRSGKAVACESMGQDYFCHQHPQMPRYIRALVPGGSFSWPWLCSKGAGSYYSRKIPGFAGGLLLMEHIADLRAAFAAAHQRRPFTIDAIAVLPDHLHCIWMLPAGDSDFSSGCRPSRHVLPAAFRPVRACQHAACRRVNAVSGSGGSRSTSSAMNRNT